MSTPRGPKGIDWDAAYTLWASMPRTARSFGRVAKEFGVSDTMVRRVAERDRWRERVAAIDRNAAARVEQRVTRAHEVRTAEALEVIDLLQQQLLARAKAGDVVVDITEYVQLAKLAQLLAGEPTERVDVREVKSALIAFVTRVAVLVPAERQHELEAQLDWFEGELRGLDPGGESEA